MSVKTEAKQSSAETTYKLSHPIRMVTAASLFDGHDASINIMRRLLQASGAEVIHLGHNRSVEEIVRAAVHEDASAIAISSYQGGHVEFFKYTIERLKHWGCSHIQVFGGGGGTITPDEKKELEAFGVGRLYSPDEGLALGLQGIIDDILRRSDQDPLQAIQWDSLSKHASEPRALAQLLTCVEQGEKAIEAFKKGQWKKILSITENAQSSKTTVVGMTGTGGAGKSSLTDELVLRILESDPQARVAILAVDPTKRKTGGALLGDRLRMNSLQSERVFMRSLATRQADSAISQATKDCLGVLRTCGFDWIFLETGGIGQADTSVVGLTDLNIYVMTSEFGAPTQLEKINMLDYCDLVAINKFEKAGSPDALLDVRKQLSRNRPQLKGIPLDRFPVFGTRASQFADEGVNMLFAHLLSIRRATGDKLIPLKQALPSKQQASPLVPRERTQYLADIAHVVRAYKQKFTAALPHLKTLDAVESLSKLALNAATQSELQALAKAASNQLDSDLSSALTQFEERQTSYTGDTLDYQVRDKTHSVPLVIESLSQQKIRKISLPRFVSKADLAKFIWLENLPGYFPFTAGVFPLKRTEEDPKRQFAGEGTPTRTNTRFHLLCAGEKAKRLSTAFDSVTLYGEDPDERPDIYGKIGESGVSICTLDDMKKLYAGFDLCDPYTSVSMTINGPAPILLAFFFNTAIDQQVAAFSSKQGRAPSSSELSEIRSRTLSTVRGTVQADILKEDQAQNTCIFSTEFALRMMGDMQQYFIEKNIRNYYSVSISGYHIAEAGANPISQLAFTLANGFTYVEYYLARGMPIDSFAPNFSFFFSNGLDPEYTVLGRVARRIWALAMKYRYGASERSQKLKYHIQTSGRSLHAQEISFNDIRTTLQALIAYLDQCNSLHTNAYDEAITTPTEESVRRAMAIQLIIAKEFGWAKNENSYQGSFFLEELTELVEEAVLNEFLRISTRGGVLGAMETHYQRSKIQEESLHYEKLKHSGELPIVGVNTFLSGKAQSEPPREITRASAVEKKEQIVNLRAYQKKNAKEASEALARLKAAALGGKNIFDALMDAARVCSLGQMSQALYQIGGQYRRGV